MDSRAELGGTLPCIFFICNLVKTCYLSRVATIDFFSFTAMVPSLFLHIK